MTAPLVIQMPGLPTPWARAGRGKGFTFTPAKQRGAMADLKVVASSVMAGRAPLLGPLKVEAIFQYPWPKSMSPKKRALPANRWRASRPDVDNLFKLVADGLNGIVWSDDALIAHATVSKVYGEAAHTLIEVMPAEAMRGRAA